MNTSCVYLKLVFDKNYVNRFNIFNQVMLVSIEFLGRPYVDQLDKQLETEEEKEIKNG